MCHLLFMPSLTLIETEAQRLSRRIPLTRRRTLQGAVVQLCECYWQELRGPQPQTTMRQALWSVTPPLSDLFIDLYRAGDVRLDEALAGYEPAQGMALLVLAQIENDDEASVHISQEAMMVFETPPPPQPWLERVASLLRGALEMPGLHHHDTHTPLWKALYVIASHSKRFDLPAALAVIQLLLTDQYTSLSVRDHELEILQTDVAEAGIRFLEIAGDHIYFAQHGHQHKPVRPRQLADMLLEIRQLWLR
jgi:hypothetical protein